MPCKASPSPNFGGGVSQPSSKRAYETCGKERGSPFVSVAVRVKPTAADASICIWPKPADGPNACREVCCHRGYLLEEHEFSRVFGPEDDNRRLFEGLQGPAIADSVFSGVSETLFAYGQTGSGKTHTIFGTGVEAGLLQFFVRAVFDRAEQCPSSTVHVCCYEVMGDTLTDLINPDAMVSSGVLRREDVVSDELFLKTQKFRYKIVQVDSKATCLSLLHEARVNRTAGVSSCNPNSSRSHAIVHLFVQNPNLEGVDDGGASSGSNSSIGALTLVDLAGTEKEHENPSEQGRKSARLLNTSLSSLNRLLRKLQSNGLDESDRRQSVLNKCLWEYLRPGCGIALIFCVSPLLRHRATSLSTLSMATASKLIRSRRTSQYIQLPAPGQGGYSLLPPGAASPISPRNGCQASPARREAGATPRRARDGSVDAARQRAQTPDAALRTPRAGTPARAAAAAASRASTPRRAASSTPGGGRGSNSAAAASRAGYAGSTPTTQRLAAASTISPFCLPPAGFEDRLPQERAHSQAAEASAANRLESQNSKLRQKLSRSRVRSRERLVSIQQERTQLSTENAVLRQECESLRSLFIRQQQQQIAFWAGPFMEMILPKCSSQIAELAAASPLPPPSLLAQPPAASETDGAAMMGERQDPPKPLTAEIDLVKSSWEVMPDGARTDLAWPEALQSLMKDRDYWQHMAVQLKSEIRAGAPPCLDLEKPNAAPLEGELSTSSKPSSTASGTLRCSVDSSGDSGSESIRSTAET